MFLGAWKDTSKELTEWLIQKLDMQMERQMIQITSISGLQIMQRLVKVEYELFQDFS